MNFAILLPNSDILPSSSPTNQSSFRLKVVRIASTGVGKYPVVIKWKTATTQPINLRLRLMVGTFKYIIVASSYWLLSST